MTTPNQPEDQTPQGWAAPTGAGNGQDQTPPPYGQEPPQQPQYGQQAPQQPQYGQQQPQYGQQQQWGQQPPAQNQWGQGGQYGQAPSYGGPGGPGMFNQNVKPGIIALRPLSLGEIYDGAFTAIRREPKIMLGLVALVVAVITLAMGILGYVVAKVTAQSGVAQGIDGEFDIVFGDAMDIFAASGVPLSAGAFTINGFITFGQLIATTLATGLVVVAISQAVLNKPMTPGEVFERGKKRIWGLLGISIVPSILLVLGFTIVVFVFGFLIFSLGSMDSGLGAIVGIVGVLVIIIGIFAVLFISIRWLLAPAALMLEERKVFASLGRSWRLTKGSFWRVFGIYLLTSIIASVISQAISTVLLLISNALFPLGYDVSFGALLAMLFVQIIASTITVSFTVAVVAILYIDIRMRREALDVELTAAANFDR